MLGFFDRSITLTLQVSRPMPGIRSERNNLTVRMMLDMMLEQDCSWCAAGQRHAHPSAAERLSGSEKRARRL